MTAQFHRAPHALGALAPLFLAAAVHAQASLFASHVVDYAPGGGGGIFDPLKCLGAPMGEGLDNGSLDVTSLGADGTLTLGFDVTIADGPGADFSVCENAFTFGGEPFCEDAWVEVSTDGVHFARLPNRYAGPATGLPGFTSPFGTHAGLAGVMPVIANAATNSIDPRDLPYAGGDGFDLHALAGDPLVVAGQLDLGAIHFVRLRDVANGTGLDSAGNAIFDNAGATGSADIDAVCVIQHTGSIVAGQPEVDLFLDAQGYLNLRVEDPEGAADFDTSSIHASLNLRAFGFRYLARRLVPDITPTPDGWLLRSAEPVVGTGIHGVLSVSIQDLEGHFSTDQITLQG